MYMSIIIKLNNHLEDTKVSVPFTKPNAVKCVAISMRTKTFSGSHIISLLLLLLLYFVQR